MRVAPTVAIVVAGLGCSSGDPKRHLSAVVDASRASAAPVDALLLTGAPSAEAAARQFTQAVVDRDVHAMHALVITPAYDRGLYDCSRRPDYPVDQRVEESMDEMLATISFGEARAKAKERVEIGAWTENTRKLLAADEAVTMACNARRGLAIIQGNLELAVVDAKGKRRNVTAAFVMAEVGGPAVRLANAMFIEKSAKPK